MKQAVLWIFILTLGLGIWIQADNGLAAEDTGFRQLPMGILSEPARAVCDVDCCSEPPALPLAKNSDRGDADLIANWRRIDNPATDGWPTEIFNQIANRQLKKIGNFIAHPEQLTPGNLEPLLTPDFSCSPLRPSELKTTFKDESLQVTNYNRRTNLAPELSYHGASGLHQALSNLLAPLTKASNMRYKFKVFRVEEEAETVVTRQYFAISGRLADKTVELNATWVIRWKKRKEKTGETLKFATLTLEKFEEVTWRNNESTIFSDCSTTVLGHNPNYQSQIQKGLNYWLNRQDNPLENSFLGTPGIAVGDLNGDGLEDLYLCQELGLPNQLFLQQADGRADEVAADYGLDFLESSRSALILDFDNDGDQDLAIAVLGGIIINENLGSGDFKLHQILPTSDDTMSLSAADYDQDGDLDIYVTAYYPNRRVDGTRISPAIAGTENRFVYHDANNGPANSLWRNRSSETGVLGFTNATEEVGLNQNNHRYSLAAAWEDFDNDGDQDLYVANDYGRDSLYRNDLNRDGTRHFVAVDETAGAVSSGGGMSISWGDYNRDGLMDALVSGMWSSAGNRITTQTQFKKESITVKKRLQKFAKGCYLLKNNNSGKFSDVARSSGMEMGRWAWGSRFADFNNDGWEDVVIANGFITGNENGGDL